MGIAELDTAVGPSTRMIFDTSSLVAYHNRHEPVHFLARHLLRRVENDIDPLRGYFSVTSAVEMLVRPLRTSDSDFTFMHVFLTTFPNLTILPMDLPVAIQAATVRALTNVRLPDAVIIASGLLSGCECIVTNDATWHRRLQPLFAEFRWLYLGHYL